MTGGYHFMYHPMADLFSQDYKRGAIEVIEAQRGTVCLDGEQAIAGSRFHSNEQVFHALVFVMSDKYGPVCEGNLQFVQECIVEPKLAKYVRLALVMAAEADYEYSKGLDD